jgi:hypothetical protein
VPIQWLDLATSDIPDVAVVALNDYDVNLTPSTLPRRQMTSHIRRLSMSWKKRVRSDPELPSLLERQPSRLLAKYPEPDIPG